MIVRECSLIVTILILQKRVKIKTELLLIYLYFIYICVFGLFYIPSANASFIT
jgi:hypothetical protein